MNLMVILPELVVFATILVFLGLSLATRPAPRALQATALVLAVAGLAAAIAAVGQQDLMFVDTYRVDRFSQIVKILLAAGLVLIIVACRRPAAVTSRREPEFYFLVFTTTLAMMMLVSAVHLLSLYITLELSSYSLYVLVALQRNKSLGLEGSLKYFLIGVISSAVMLFGMALLYGATGKTYLADLAPILAQLIYRPMVTIALALTLGGFFFKLAVFPFHFWAPDAYQAAPHPLAAFIATVSKVAAVAVLLRVVMNTAAGNRLLTDLLVMLAIVSMTVGNLAAIGQKDFKRLMAFSSVAHAGYVLIGILCISPEAAAAGLFYAMALVLMKFTSFWVITMVSTDGGNPAITDLAGLHRRSPLLAMALMVSLFGLAGIPPTVGFTAKLLIFTAAVRQGYLVLVVIAMFNVVVSLYYYLSAIKAAYLIEPAHPESGILPLSLPARALTLALVAAMLITGLYPQPFIEWLRPAAEALF